MRSSSFTRLIDLIIKRCISQIFFIGKHLSLLGRVRRSNVLISCQFVGTLIFSVVRILGDDEHLTQISEFYRAVTRLSCQRIVQIREDEGAIHGNRILSLGKLEAHTRVDLSDATQCFHFHLAHVGQGRVA